MVIHQKISVPNCQKLKTVVKRRKDQKLRIRNFDARHGKIESGAVIKSRKGPIGVEGGKGICFQWKEKGQCSQGDRCSFRHETQDRAQKLEHTAATPSEPTASRGRSVSRKSRILGRSNHGSILRQPCRYYLKGTFCSLKKPREHRFDLTRSAWNCVQNCIGFRGGCMFFFHAAPARSDSRHCDDYANIDQL